MKLGMNSTEMQKSNRTQVFRALLEHGEITRAKISAELGLQKATITNIINEFFELDIVEVVGDAAAGRRGENLRLRLEGIYILSMGITRKDYQMAVYSLNGEQKENQIYRFKKDENIRQAVLQMAGHASELLEKYGKENVVGICMAVPGPYMHRNNDGREIFDVSEFPQWDEVDVRKIIETALGRPVTMVLDAKLSAYAEWRNAKEAKENKKVSMIVLRSRGFGIGAGIIINGQIVEGQLGIAGEVGHMGINYNGRSYEDNSFEACAGTDSAVRYMAQRLNEFPESPLREDSSYYDILDAYGRKDPLAVWTMQKIASILGYGIVNIIYLVNPDCIILGADYPNDEEFLDSIRKVVAEHVHPLVAESAIIRYSELKEDSFLLGGYYYLIEKLCNSNQIFDIIRHLKGRDI